MSIKKNIVSAMMVMMFTLSVMIITMFTTCGGGERKTEAQIENLTAAETASVENIETDTEESAQIEIPSACELTAADAAAGSHFNPDINYGSFTDPRDNQIYRTVRIGSRTWMAENLNYRVSGSWCYDNDNSNCEKYGRLYFWTAAMAIDATYNVGRWGGNDANHRGVCPPGWRLPSDADWDALVVAVAGTNRPDDAKLRARTNWCKRDDNIFYRPGTDDFGFSALPGGSRWSGDYSGIGLSGSWWSATEIGDMAWSRHIYDDGFTLRNSGVIKDLAFSVRCVRN